MNGCGNVVQALTKNLKVLGLCIKMHAHASGFAMSFLLVRASAMLKHIKVGLFSSMVHQV